MISEQTGQILYKNDTDRLKEEHIELKERNPDLYDIIDDVCDWAWVYCKKDIVITMIYRTDAEQDSIYKDDPKYQQKKFKSPHQFYHAVDLRSSTFDTEQIQKLVDYLNEQYNGTNYYKWTAKCHDVGLGDHFHIQFVRKS